MTTNSVVHSSDKTLILISGAAHGSWCWKKIIPLLTSLGQKVIAIDLPGSGDDTAKLADHTLDNDVNSVMDAANAVSGKVILLGHSSGGVIVSQAAELLGTGKVDKLIYLDAFLPQHGESVFAVAEKLSKRNQPSHVSITSAAERFVFSNDGSLFKWNPELVHELLYHDCSKEDVVFAKAQLSWQSVATLATPVHLSDSVYGRIKKYFIVCEQAKDLDKSSLRLDVQCEKVYEMQSSHSPFFSMPKELAAILAALY